MPNIDVNEQWDIYLQLWKSWSTFYPEMTLRDLPPHGFREFLVEGKGIEIGKKIDEFLKSMENGE